MKGTHQCDFINFCGAFGPQLDSEMHQISLDIAVSSQKQARCFKTSQIRCFCTSSAINLPGWRWAGIKQLALVGSSSSLHSEACKALGGSDGVIHSRISDSGGRVRANTNVFAVVPHLDRHGHGVAAVQLLRPCPTALAGGGTRDGVAILQWDEHLLGRDWFVARRWPPLFVSIVAMQMMPAAIPRRMHRISSELRS